MLQTRYLLLSGMRHISFLLGHFFAVREGRGTYTNDIPSTWKAIMTMIMSNRGRSTLLMLPNERIQKAVARIPSAAFPICYDRLTLASVDASRRRRRVTSFVFLSRFKVESRTHIQETAFSHKLASCILSIDQLFSLH